MSADPAAANDAGVTLREFANGQKVFKRYTLIKTLGRGGMGVVWLARDEELERNVALKFLPDLVVHDRAVLTDMKRETRRSLELTHRNIVRIYDFVHDESSGCISMEYIDGDTLSNLRADKEHKVFETGELADWVSQLCDALDYAHSHAHIIHRDLKPSNLMINQRGDLKVADFGIARRLTESVSMLTMEHTKSGTLLYMSPQQLDGDRGSHLDDVYSLGASIYELVTGRPPFYTGNVDRQIREKIPPSMAERRKELEMTGEPIDPVWEDTIAACLSKEPARRPQSVAEVAQRLAVAGPQTRRAQQTKVVTKPKPSKQQLIIAGIAATAIALLVWFLIGWVFKSRHPEPKVAVAPPVVATQPSTTPVPKVEQEPSVAPFAVKQKAEPRPEPSPSLAPPKPRLITPANDFAGG